MLEVGSKAPDFELPDQNGKIHILSMNRELSLKPTIKSKQQMILKIC